MWYQRRSIWVEEQRAKLLRWHHTAALMMSVRNGSEDGGLHSKDMGPQQSLILCAVGVASTLCVAGDIFKRL